jgi:hypothetical protein
VLSFLLNPSSDSAAKLTEMVAWTAGRAIHMMTRVLAVKVHGSGFFQQPRNFPKQVLDHSIVLGCITSAATHLMRPDTGQLLPPSPLDEQHLNEWRETADYAATILALLGGVVGLETGFLSPLLGESRLLHLAQCALW